MAGMFKVILKEAKYNITTTPANATIWCEQEERMQQEQGYVIVLTDSTITSVDSNP
jgi:hypothetical protein